MGDKMTAKIVEIITKTICKHDESIDEYDLQDWVSLVADEAAQTIEDIDPWISVEERLPTEESTSKLYLIRCVGTEGDIHYFDALWLKGRWFGNSCILQIYHTVTHWQDILPPKGQ